MLVATYGGLSYLGPFMGVPTCAFYSDDVFNTVHMDVLRAAERGLAGDGASRRSALLAFDIQHLDLIDRLAAEPAGAPFGA